jgi:hypothetical protein
MIFPEDRVFDRIEGSRLCRDCLLFLPVPGNYKFHGNSERSENQSLM